MTPVSLDSSTIQEMYALAPKPGSPAGSAPGSSVQTADAPADSIQLSPAALREVALTGRVAGNVAAGNLTSDQTQLLYGQISSIQGQIAADRQAGGGTLSATDRQAIQQSQNQLSGTIFSDAHNGAAPPSDPNVTQAAAREALEAGRITLNEKAGNLSSGQAQQLGSRLGTIQQQIATDEQTNGGTLSPADAQAINQLQNQLSQQIHLTAHPAVGPEPMVNPA
jgi:hypothetical protein